MITTRRSFITATAALFCAPAIVRASSLMPVKVPKLQRWVAVMDATPRLDHLDIDDICWRLFIKSNHAYHEYMEAMGMGWGS